MDRIAGEPHPPLREVEPGIPAAFEAIRRSRWPETRSALRERGGDSAALRAAPDSVRRATRSCASVIAGPGKLEARLQPRGGGAHRRRKVSRPGARHPASAGGGAAGQWRVDAGAHHRRARPGDARRAAVLDRIRAAAELGKACERRTLPLPLPRPWSTEAPRCPGRQQAADPAGQGGLRRAPASPSASSPTSPITTVVKDEDAAACAAYLNNLCRGFPRAAARPSRSAGGLPCEINLRADYETGTRRHRAHQRAAPRHA